MHIEQLQKITIFAHYNCVIFFPAKKISSSAASRRPKKRTDLASKALVREIAVRRPKGSCGYNGMVEFVAGILQCSLNIIRL
jgi:hypothetical protein